MKRSSRVSFINQSATPLLECAVVGSMFGDAFKFCS
jgi:hypothetical protein